VVVPPQAAAIEPVFQSSAEVVPMKGISRWVWGSMAPGRMYFPVASTVSSALAASPVPMVLIFSPSMNTSATWLPPEVTINPFFNSTLIAFAS
jgi:hypothetical protein